MALSTAGRSIEDLRLSHDVAVDAFSGGATLRVAVPVPPGRAGLRPDLALVHSGAENSAFGVGWSLAGIPTISLDTRKRLPRYDGRDALQFDGAELVPWLDASGAVREHVDGAYRVTFLRVRRGIATARIERWTHEASRRVHFRVREASNAITIFGARPNGEARIADPDDPTRVLAWLPELHVDAHGNAIRFDWILENLDGVDRSRPEEQRRPATAQRYIKRIAYGNSQPLALADDLINGDQPVDLQWHFHVVFDYGDHSAADRPLATPDRSWLARSDPFSSARCGFDLRTYRLCRRILSFHHVSELGPDPSLVHSLVLSHQDDPAGTVLESIGLVGHREDEGIVTQRSLPPLRMDYAPAAMGAAFTPIPEEAVEHVPGGLASRRHVFVDLYGEGLPGLLTEVDRTWYWKPNLGGGRFGPTVQLAERPATRPGELAWGDHDRDGDTELAKFGGRLAGAYELDRNTSRWSGFRPLQSLPHVEGLGGRAQWVDLDGDGRADILVVTADRMIWFPSSIDGADETRDLAFGAPVELPRPVGLPSVVEDASLDFFFADMNGDGLADLVRIQNGRVEYWPNMGNGRFGNGVVMDDAPAFASDRDFDASRLRFVDLDGSGTTDLVYIGAGEIRTWSNASGNRFVPGPVLAGLPTLDNHASVRVLDFLGDGRPCLVWSTLAAAAPNSIHYLPLGNETRARALLSVEDSRGLEVRLWYRSSSVDYLRDRDTRPWTSRLPMHRLVVERRELIDHVNASQTVTRYEYHDGFYDSDERQVRGFGQVDAFDADVTTEDALDAPAFAAPALTRTWFHLGTSMWNHERPSDTWGEDADLIEVAPHVLDANLLGAAPDELTDALRCATGAIVRRELFSIGPDGMRGAHPFEVFQSCVRIRRAQPRAGAHRAAFEVLPHASQTAVYEQAALDPRVSQHLTLEVDGRGHVTRDAEVFHPRRPASVPDVSAQGLGWIRVHEHRVAHVDTEERFELGIPIEGRDLELNGIDVPPGRGLLAVDFAGADVVAAIADPISHEAPWPGHVAARLLTWEQSYFWNTSRTAPLPLGYVGDRLLVHHEEAAVFATELVDSVFGEKLTAARLIELGYFLREGYWWRADDVHLFESPAHFDLPVGRRRRDGSETRSMFDPHDLTVVQIAPAIGPPTVAELDWHVLAPFRVTDPNGAVTEVRYDPLGVVVAASRYGQVAGRPWGHASLSVHAPRTPSNLADVFASPEHFLQDASEFVFYDLDAWSREQSPVAVARLARESLLHDGFGSVPSGERAVTRGVTFFDGAGRVRQSKSLVDAGLAIQRDAGGHVVIDAAGLPVLASAPERWRSSGGVIHDTKGRPSRKYQPFFTPTWRFENDDVLRHVGPATQTLYDAIGRPVRIDHPNGTFERTTFGAWSITHADANDTVEESTYRALREARPPDDPERQAYEHARSHTNTPITTFLDPEGREAGVLVRGGTTHDRRTETQLDAQGRPRQIRDARGLLAFSYVRDMEGRSLHEVSADAGPRWSLSDAEGRPALAWEARGFAIETSFDLLDRPTTVHVRGNGLNHVVEQRRYGEELSSEQARARNLHGRLAELRDQSGILTVAQADPGGRALTTVRRLREEVEEEADWRVAVALGEQFEIVARYDALGRATQETLPDGTRRTISYGAAGGIASVHLTTPDGVLHAVPIVAATDHDAHGERTRLLLGNNVETTFTYDRETHRLVRQLARRSARRYQELVSTFDPAGKLVRLHDLAHEGSGAVIDGAAVPARFDFVYDAHYRVVRATGRVHQALLEHDFIPGAGGSVKGTRHISLDNAQALERYTREYTYDEGGNLLRHRHASASRTWATTLWVSPNSNRALPARDPSGAPVSDPESRFDAAGHLMRLDHLRLLEHSWRGTLSKAVVIERADGAHDAEAYSYDANHQRVRKVWSRVVHDGLIEQIEKVYVGGQDRKRIYRDGRVIFEKWSTHVGDGVSRVAIVHRWVQDDLGRESDELTTRVHYILGTHQGSSTIELDEDGEIITYEEYVPHGGAAFIAGRRARGVDIKEYRYCGKEQDDATSLYYYGYRYLAPWLGRWLIPDPLGPEDDLNLYQFVLGDPVGNVDPNGLQTTAPGEVFEYVDRDAKYNQIPAEQKQKAINLFNSRMAAAEGIFVTDAVKVENGWVITAATEIEPARFLEILEETPDINEAFKQYKWRLELVENIKKLGESSDGTAIDFSSFGSASKADPFGRSGHGGILNSAPSAGVKSGGRGGARDASGGDAPVASGQGGTGTGTQGAGSGTGTGTIGVGSGQGTDPSGTGTGTGKQGSGRGAGGAGAQPAGAGSTATGSAQGSGAAQAFGSGRGAGIKAGVGVGGAGSGSGHGARGQGGSGLQGGIVGGTGQRPRPSGTSSGTATKTGGKVDPSTGALRDDIPPGFRVGFDPNGTVDGKAFGSSGTGAVDNTGGRSGSLAGDKDGKPGGSDSGSTNGSANGDPHRTTDLDVLLGAAGIANMEYVGERRGGRSGGVPGGFGSWDLGWAGQLGYVAVTAALVVSGAFIVGKIARGIAKLGGRAIRRLAPVVRRMGRRLRDVWHRARRMFPRRPRVRNLPDSASRARPITPDDLGIDGAVSDLRGTIELQPDGTVRVVIDMLEADIRNPFRIMSNLETTARNMGGKKLQIEATFANPRLRDVLQRMYGMTEDPADPLIDIIVRDLTKGPK